MRRRKHFAGTPRDQAIRFDRMRSERYEVIAFCTCNSSVKREAFLRVGGFDLKFSMAAPTATTTILPSVWAMRVDALYMIRKRG